MVTGVVFNIQRFTLHDGPGIRTTVFLKGCGLRCQWCHNPEAIRPQPELNTDGRLIGEVMTIDEVLAVVEKDRRYYQNSKGGITISGGEPMQQFAFTRELLQAAKQNGLHTTLDTSGFAPQQDFEALLPHVDLFLFDIKADTSTLHRRLTGVGNERILANLAFLVTHGAAVRLRCPLIPGINDSPAHLHFIAELNTRYPQLDGIDLMPFHNLAAGKWQAVHRAWELGDLPSANADDRTRWITELKAAGCDKVTLG